MYLSLVVLELCSWHPVFISCTKLRMDQLRAKLMVWTINFYLKKKINADIVVGCPNDKLLPSSLYLFLFLLFFEAMCCGVSCYWLSCDMSKMSRHVTYCRHLLLRASRITMTGLQFLGLHLIKRVNTLMNNITIVLRDCIIQLELSPCLIIIFQWCLVL